LDRRTNPAASRSVTSLARYSGHFPV
jgi:hypothetical protein